MKTILTIIDNINLHTNHVFFCGESIGEKENYNVIFIRAKDAGLVECRLSSACDKADTFSVDYGLQTPQGNIIDFWHEYGFDQSVVLDIVTLCSNSVIYNTQLEMNHVLEAYKNAN